MKRLTILLIVFQINTFITFFQASAQFISNPIMGGYFADPSIVKDGDTYYIYATIDPWGGEDLAVFETKDFIKFDRKKINWPTKKACTSSTSKGAMVWAPSVVKAPNGKFYMYVSVGSEVWAGTSDNPLGPWSNLKSDNSSLIPGNSFPRYHMIDAECFIDNDGQAYLYWGSGWNWVNGKCFAVKLAKDMVTFMDKPQDITPPNYFEGPFMIKRDGQYYLMYSEGKAIDETYKVRYSIGKTPMGPWKEGANSPILFTSADSTILGPGHHCVFRENNQDYILYHKIFPQKQDYVLRQLCIDSLNFDKEGNIKTVIPKGIKPINKAVSDTTARKRPPRHPNWVHDPVMVKEGDTYYVYGTGISVKTSKDRLKWENMGRLFNTQQEWWRNDIPEQKGDLWAPDIHYRNGKFHLYYSVSAWMNFNSSIGYATNVTLDPKNPDYKWVDHGKVIDFRNGGDSVNCIDPNVFVDDDGRVWLFYGSYKAGLRLVELDPVTGKLKNDPPVLTVITKALGEGVFVIKTNEWYYIFASRGRCCAGLESTYQIVMGRSKNIRGPYLNKNGESWVDNKYTIFLAGDYSEPGRGHNGFFTENDTTFIVYHAYTRSANGASLLNIKPMHIDKDGWPTLDSTQQILFAKSNLINLKK